MVCTASYLGTQVYYCHVILSYLLLQSGTQPITTGSAPIPTTAFPPVTPFGIPPPGFTNGMPPAAPFGVPPYVAPTPQSKAKLFTLSALFKFYLI